MTERSISPLAAAVGLVAVTAEGVRKLPGLLVGVTGAARHKYDALALHGKDVLAGRPATEVMPVEVPVDEPVGPPVATPGGSVAEAEPVAEPEPVVEAVVVEPETAPPVPTPPPGRTEPVVLTDDQLDEVAQVTPGDELSHADLPLADFDHQTLPQLRGRLRTLGLPELVQLRDYEQAHAARLPVLTLLDNRIAKLSSDTGQ